MNKLIPLAAFLVFSVLSTLGSNPELTDAASRFAIKIEETASDEARGIALKKVGAGEAKLVVPKEGDPASASRVIECAYLHYQAMIDKEKAIVEISVYHDAESARDSLASAISRMSVGPASRVFGIGDEAFRATEVRGTLFFRRGLVLVEISSSNAASLKIATLIDESLLESTKPQQSGPQRDSKGQKAAD